MTIRELILELRKIGNHDALVEMDARGHIGTVRSIEVHELGPGSMVIYLRDYPEKLQPLSSSRRVVWSEPLP